MQKISPEIRAAMLTLYGRGVSRPWIARRCGVSNSVVLAWMTRAENIREDNWRKLYPLLKEFLPADMPPPAELPDAASNLPEQDPLLTELLTHWPHLTRGEQARVVSAVIDLREKKGRAAPPEER